MDKNDNQVADASPATGGAGHDELMDVLKQGRFRKRPRFSLLHLLVGVNTLVIVGAAAWYFLSPRQTSEPVASLELPAVTAAPTTQRAPQAAPIAEAPPVEQEAVSSQSARLAMSQKDYSLALVRYTRLCQAATRAEDFVMADFFRLRAAQCMKCLGRNDAARAALMALGDSVSPAARAWSSYELAAIALGEGQFLQARSRAYAAIAALHLLKSSGSLEADCDFIIGRAMTTRAAVDAPNLKWPEGGLSKFLDALDDSNLRAALTEHGFEVETAGSGREGLEKSRFWDPLVFMVDVGEGLPTVRAFKNDDQARTVPIIVHSSGPVEDQTVVASLDAGANDLLARPYSAALLGARVAAQMSIYRSQVELREKVVRDELTGVFSRRYLFESMRQHVNQFSRPGPPVLSCLMIDVDYFKRINDTLGHIEGDRILRLVAEMIFGMTRKGDVVARFGGEEFVVILPSTDPEGARLVAEKLLKAVETDCGVTVSIGVSWYRSPTEVGEKSPYSDEDMMQLLLSRADAALYEAKRSGRNQVRLQAEHAGPERRGIPRLEASFKIQIRRADGLELEVLTEVSAGGFGLRHVETLQVGDILEITVPVDTGPAKASGRVVWRSEGGDHCGVMFDTFESDGHERLIHELGHRARVRRRES